MSRFGVARRLAGLLAFSLLLGNVPGLATLSSAAALPPGFSDTNVAGGLGAPTAVAQLPDGRFLVTSQTGRLWLIQGGGSTTALDLSVCTESEQGLLGVTVDPQFSTNGFVYLFYTAPIGSCDQNGASPGGAKNRVSRFTMTGSTVSPGSETVLLDNMPVWGDNHNGGDVRVANDGTLFVSVGDGGTGRPDGVPADLSLPNGKILRINRDGTIPAGNPHGALACKNSWGPPGASRICGEIWADGLRNPFRLGFDVAAPGAKFRINDVGAADWEEVDEGVAGAHYGWPCREGPDPGPGSAPCNTPVTEPVLFYQHSTGCNVITGGAFVPSGTWTGYEDAYLFVDFGCGQLFVAQPGQTGTPPATLTTGMNLTTDLEFFPSEGSYQLFYTTYAGGGQLRRIVGPSPPPSALSDTKFTGVQPTRVLDTRTGIGIAAGKLGPSATISVNVITGGVPADAKAIALNLTATNADGPGFVTAWPAGQARPPTSSVNLSGFDETAANAVVVAVGQSSQINLFTLGGTHLVADVTGYFTSAGTTNDGRFEAAASPTRVLDTRTGTGGKVTPFEGGDQFDLAVTGSHGVPTDATAVALTVTYTNVGEPGYLTLWATGLARPTASTSNPNGPGDIRSNLALISVGATGKISIYSHRRTDVVVDIVGWFTTRTASQGLFTVVTPQRVADSRQPGAPISRIGSGAEVSMNFTNLAPSPAAAVLYNLTATNTVAGGYITAYPLGTVRPEASS